MDEIGLPIPEEQKQGEIVEGLRDQVLVRLKESMGMLR